MPASLLLAVGTQFAQLAAVWFPMQAVRGNVLELNCPPPLPNLLPCCVPSLLCASISFYRRCEQRAGRDHAQSCWLTTPAYTPCFMRAFPIQAVRGNVLEVIMEKDQRGQREVLMKDLDLEQVRTALHWLPSGTGIGLQHAPPDGASARR